MSKKQFVMNSEFWASILPEYSTSEKREHFVNMINNAFDHRTSPYPKIIRSWLSFYVMYYRYVFLQGNNNMWYGTLYQMNNTRMYMMFSPDISDEKDQSAGNAVKKILRKTHKSKVAEYKELMTKIETFFRKLYDKALECGCEFNKKCDWQTFYDNLDIEEVIRCYKDCGLSLFEEEIASHDEEKFDDEEDSEYEAEYVFDALSDDYLALVHKHMPRIRSIADYNAISWFIFSSDKKNHSKHKPEGLLDTAKSVQKEDFYNNNFGINDDLDAHFIYAFGFELLNVVCMYDLLDKINEAARDVLTVSSGFQVKCVKDQSLNCDENSLVLFDFFFNKLAELAHNCLEAIAFGHKIANNKDKNTYDLAIDFINICMSDPAKLLHFKECIMEIVPSKLL